MQKVRWGVIGAGGIADRRTIPGLLMSENAQLVAVMDICGKTVEAVAKKYSVENYYDIEDKLLEHQNIDAVYIASPVSAHYKQAVKAAKAGKHILMEKPLALDTKQGKELIVVCKNQNVLFAAGFMMRFHPYHIKAKELVSSGALGDIVSMRAQLTCWYPDMQGAWRQNFAESGGGALMDMGIHCIDLLQYISGAKVRSVSALLGTKTFNYDTEDSASVLMEFSNGAYGYVDSNFNIPDDAAECRLEIYGTKGSILAAGTISQAEGGTFNLTLSDNSDYDAEQNRKVGGNASADVEFGNMYAKEITSFGRSVLEGIPLEVPSEDALNVQHIIECAYRSAKERRFIEVEELND